MFDESYFCFSFQINCVQQLENIAAYPFLKDRLNNNNLMLHAIWYDIYSGNVYLLSQKRQRFVEVNERSYFSLMQEVKGLELNGLSATK